MKLPYISKKNCNYLIQNKDNLLTLRKDLALWIFKPKN